MVDIETSIYRIHLIYIEDKDRGFLDDEWDSIHLKGGSKTGWAFLWTFVKRFKAMKPQHATEQATNQADCVMDHRCKKTRTASSLIVKQG